MVRQAIKDDLRQIFALYGKVKLEREKLGDPKYEADIQKRGFLLGLDDEHALAKEIDESFLSLVALESNAVCGYLIADHRDKYTDDEGKTWFNSELKNVYYHDPHSMSITTIAVDPHWSEKGIASELLSTVEAELRARAFKHLFSIVTIAPVTNCPTIVWHTKNGFRRLAMGQPRKLFNLENYSGVLLHKEI